MSVTTFRSLRGWREGIWGLFAAANVGIMVFLESWETIPFHLVWLSMALLYGFRVWKVTTTVVVVVAVMLVTGVALARAAVQAGEGLDELAEVPLMAGIFATVAWHARRRQAIVEELHRTAHERDFIRDASHQLRTPITVAKGHAELILAAHPRSTVASDVMIIVGELERLSTISDRLLMLVAAEQPGFLDPVPVEIGSLVESTITRWRPVASRRWHARVARRGTVLVDRERIECALDALIENAVSATKDGDLIAIAANVEGHTMLIDVIDEGAGISPGDLQRIFGRFSRGGGSGSRRNGGTGHGLAVVKAIAEAHDGSLTAWSEPSRGTTFRLRLNGGRTAATPSSHGGGIAGFDGKIDPTSVASRDSL
jgi:two-component system OmpR family sensor kinase